MANLDDLDSGGVRCTEAHTDLLCAAFNLVTLWEDHGVVGNFTVRTPLSCPD
jgi:hypothetical protein